jgi:signal transduction histidine kinase
LFADSTNLLQLLRSRLATAPLLYLSFTPLLVYSVWSRLDATQQSISVWESLLIAVSAAALSLFAFTFFSRVMGRLRSTGQISAAFAPLLWVLAAVTTNISVTIARTLVGIPQPFRLSGLILTILITVLSMGIATYGLTVFLGRREQLRQIEVACEDLRRVQEDASAFARDQRAALVATIDTVVSPELQRLRLQAVQLDDEPSLASVRYLQNAVSSYSSNVVRTLSREIAGGNPASLGQPSQGSRPDAPLKEFLLVLSAARLGMPLIILMAALLTLAQFRVRCIPELTLGLVVFIAIETVLWLIGRMRWLQGRGVSFAWLVTSACAGFLVFKVLLAGSSQRCQWSASGIPFSVGIIFAFASLLALAAVIQATNEAREAIAAVGRANELMAEATRLLRADGVLSRDQISQLLHGPVQGRLAAISMALQIHLNDVKAGNSPSIKDLRERATVLFDEVSSELHQIIERTGIPSEGLFEVIERQRSQWRGLLVITTDCSDVAARVLQRSPQLSILAGECAEEAITNASRHGRARRVHVRVTVGDPEGPGLVMLVEDDGNGVPANIEPGFGLTRVALLGESWRLEPMLTGGSRLTIHMRIPAET